MIVMLDTETKYNDKEWSFFMDGIDDTKVCFNQKYKISRFNNFTEKEAYLLIFNSKTNGFFKIPKLLFENWSNNNILKDRLLEEGIIVDTLCDEEKQINYDYNNHLFDPLLRLTILSSEQCNFRCSYCYEKFEKGNITKEVCDSLLKWIRKNIKNYSGIQVSWFGGEPLLGIKKIEYLTSEIKKICRQSKRPYSSGITTNGYLLNKKNFNRLIKNDVRSFAITFDGTFETHDKYRKMRNGRATFETILNNMKDIRDENKSRTFKIIIRCNLTIESLQNLEKYMEIMNKEFYRDNRFSFIFRPVGDWGGDEVNKIEDKLLNSFEDFYEPILKLVKKYPLNFQEYGELLKNSLCDSSRKNSYVIGSDGIVYKCTMLLYQDENMIGKINSAGKMLLNKEKEINWIVGNNNSLSTSCTQCPFSLSCFERTCAAKGWLLSSAGKCGYEKSTLSSVMNLLDEQNYFMEID